MPENPRAMLKRGFCPACGHRIAAHGQYLGCLAPLDGGECWCPLALALDHTPKPNALEATP